MKAILLLGCVMISLSGISQSNLNQQPFTPNQINLLANRQASQDLLGQRGLNQKLDSTTSLTYNSFDQEWYESTANYFEYHNNGKLSKSTTVQKEDAQTINEFDVSGNIIKSQYFVWDMDHYKPVERTVFKYDSNKQLKEDSTYAHDGENWKLTGYSSYTVDAQGFVLEKVSYTLFNPSFLPHSKFVFMNDVNGNILKLTTFKFLNNQWLNQFEYSYTYDSNNRITEFWYQNWSNGQWQPVFKIANYYHLNNHTEELAYFWDGSNWNNELKTDHQYNTDIQAQDAMLPTNLQMNKHQIVGSQSYINDNGMFAYGDSVSFHYSSLFPNGFDDTEPLPYYFIVQNPVRDVVKIGNPQNLDTDVSIFAMNGKLIRRLSTPQSMIEIASGDWNSGIYIIQIKSTDRFETYRIIKN